MEMFLPFIKPDGQTIGNGEACVRICKAVILGQGIYNAKNNCLDLAKCADPWKLFSIRDFLIKG